MHALLSVVLTILDLYWWVIIAVAVMSWLIAFNIVNDRNDMVRQIWNGLNALTEPLLRPIRRVLPNMGGLDISPIVLLIALSFLRTLIVEDLAPRMLFY